MDCEVYVAMRGELSSQSEPGSVRGEFDFINEWLMERATLPMTPDGMVCSDEMCWGGPMRDSCAVSSF